MSEASELVESLKNKKLTIATAESLTGGLVAATIVAVPGASAVYRCGFVTYAAESKTSLLKVPAELIAAEGVVSAQVAVAMAEGAAREGETDIGISTTGNAGPDALEGKPVGRVYTAVCIRGVTTVTEHDLEGDRESVRRQAAAAVIAECAKRLRK